MDVTIGRSNETLRLAKPHTFMAQERSIVEQAFQETSLDYTIQESSALETLSPLDDASNRMAFPALPQSIFAASFSRIHLRKSTWTTASVSSHTKGVIQVFYRPDLGRSEPYVGAVGVLQFEVLKERLKNEYRVNAVLERLPSQFARWVGGGDAAVEWLEGTKRLSCSAGSK